MIVFADSFALIAWLNAQDNAHLKVMRYLDTYAGRLITTEWVLMEVADALSAPTVRATTVGFLKAVRDDPFFEIVGYDASAYNAGFALFASRTDKAWSLTDCISFSVMSERGISDALTEDHHFEQAGFRALFK